MPKPFPFAAIVGQDEMKLALMIAAVDPSIGGVPVFGDRGTGKSTAVRALAALLPPIKAVAGCPYRCDPAGDPAACIDGCRLRGGGRPKRDTVAVPVVDLPLGATEDRVVGALDLERALATGEKAFEPGLLARANRGFLYIDEVNLLEDHLVDVLLDVAASGENVVERKLPRLTARFVLVVAENGRAAPPADAEPIARAAPDATIVRVPRLGHLAHEEDTGAIAAIILRAAADAGVLAAA